MKTFFDLGDYCVNLDNVAYVDFDHTWSTEEREYDRSGDFAVFVKARQVKHYGARIVFVGGATLTVPEPLVREVAAVLGRKVASREDEVIEGLPGHLQDYFKNAHKEA